jgi:methionyl-tRNA formyltransferase
VEIAIFAYDFFIDAIKHLPKQGLKISAIFTFPADNIYDHNRQIIEFGARERLPVYFHRPRLHNLETLFQQGTDTFLSLGYPYRVPISECWRGINLHPSLLPHGRGRWPLPWVLMTHRELAGLTLHKHAMEWDTGDILAQVPVPLYSDDTLETLSVKLRLKATDFLFSALNDLDRLWVNAVTQDTGSYFGMPTEEDRTITWSEGVDAILRLSRAFGKFEAIAHVADNSYFVTDAQGWKEAHSFTPGTLVMDTRCELLVAASDGYILLRHFIKKRNYGKSQTLVEVRRPPGGQ